MTVLDFDFIQARLITAAARRDQPYSRDRSEAVSSPDEQQTTCIITHVRDVRCCDECREYSEVSPTPDWSWPHRELGPAIAIQPAKAHQPGDGVRLSTAGQAILLRLRSAQLLAPAVDVSGRAWPSEGRAGVGDLRAQPLSPSLFSSSPLIYHFPLLSS